MQENGTAYTDPILAREACSAAETLGNLLFLTAHHSGMPSWNAVFSAEAESWVMKLAQFIRLQLVPSGDEQPTDAA